MSQSKMKEFLSGGSFIRRSSNDMVICTYNNVRIASVLHEEKRLKNFRFQVVLMPKKTLNYNINELQDKSYTNVPYSCCVLTKYCLEMIVYR